MSFKVLNTMYCKLIIITAWIIQRIHYMNNNANISPCVVTKLGSLRIWLNSRVRRWPQAEPDGFVFFVGWSSGRNFFRKRGKRISVQGTRSPVQVRSVVEAAITQGWQRRRVQNWNGKKLTIVNWKNKSLLIDR